MCRQRIGAAGRIHEYCELIALTSRCDLEGIAGLVLKRCRIDLVTFRSTHPASIGQYDSDRLGRDQLGLSECLRLLALDKRCAALVAIFVGIQPPSESESLADAEPRAAVTGTVSSKQSPTLDVQTVAIPSEVQQRTPELVELDEEKQRRLRAYLNQHDQMSRMSAGKQFVKFKEKPKK